MKEFGSDFHFISDLKVRNKSFQLPENARYYANGRQAIQDLILFKNWDRIWMPEYFCYEIIGAIKETGIEVKYYFDNPGVSEDNIISCLDLKEGDVLFRMNYFGLRTKRDNSLITVPVIEDHSHDLIGEWAINSNADWCIASLRKSLPISQGGILWSPKKNKLPERLSSTKENEILSQKRLGAMKLKTSYLENISVNKDDYLKNFNQTETEFNSLNISGISNDSLSIINKMDLEDWFQKKKRNWMILSNLSHTNIKIIYPESIDLCPFSLLLSFNNLTNRDLARNFLLQKNVYPAVLWPIPSTQRSEIVEYSNTSLSVHCDARYNKKDIYILRNILIEAFDKTL